MREIVWEKVYSAILQSEHDRLVADFDYEDAKELVGILADRFLVRDLKDRRFTFVERPFETEISRGVADLGGTETVVDWKVRVSGELDPAWQQRQVDSWQWRITAAALGCRVFIYRGIARQTGKVREVEIEVPEGNDERVGRFLCGLTLARRALLPLSPYPQAKPHACRAFNRICEYYHDCTYGTEPIAGLVQPRAFSYSSASRFLECPEKYRRYALDPDKDRGTEETEFGSMVHRGIAEVYRQALGL